MLWVNSRIITFGTKKQETLRSVNTPRTCSKRGPKSGPIIQKDKTGLI